MGWKRQPGLPSPEPKRDGGQRAAPSSEVDEDQTGWVSAIKVAGAGPSVWGASLDCTWTSTGYRHRCICLKYPVFVLPLDLENNCAMSSNGLFSK
jgi:hypothetical protein